MIRSARPFLAALALTFSPAVSLAADPALLAAWGQQGIWDGEFQYPHHLAVRSDGIVYVGDVVNDRVQYFNSSGAYLGQWPLRWADGIAVAPDGSVYVTGEYRMYKYSSSGTLVTSWGGSAAGSNPGEFSFPSDVAVDATGNVYVMEVGNCRIQKFTSEGTYLGQWGTAGSGDGQFLFPMGILADPNGFIWVSDIHTNRMQKFTSNGVFVWSFGTTGTGPGQWAGPGRPAMDSDGRLIVPDAGNHRIQVYTQTGEFLMQWGGFGAGPGRFNHPISVAIDAAGNLYVTDKDNHRIQKFAGVSTPALPMSWGAVKRRFR